MKPIAIFRHNHTEGPGFLADFLEARGIPWTLVRIDAGDLMPDSCQEFSGLVFMGGPMSVNDDQPWIPPALGLIREAVSSEIPVLGHCLGGQLMAKALGGTVGPGLVKEIGWGEVQVADDAIARAWLGSSPGFLGFHWHGETFTLPQGSTHILSSRYCRNQAFALGKHLGFQCHIEMTAEMVKTWCNNGANEIDQAAASPGVQPEVEILRDLNARIATLNATAETVYSHWVEGLVK